MRALIEFRSSLTCIALAALAPLAHATFITSTSQSAFLAAATSSGTDSFDSLAVGELSSLVVRSAGSFSYTASSVGGLFSMGTPDRWLSNDDRRDPISFAGFGQTVSAIGATLFGTNESGAALTDQTIVVTVTDVQLNQSITTITLNSTSSFFGVYSTVPLLSMTVAMDSSNLLAAWPTVNNLVLAVPEPATYATFLAGLMAIGAALRRRASN